MPMQQSHADQIGEAGQSALITFFNDLGWGPLPTNKHDLGTDLFVQIRGDDLTDLGMMLGVQVKTGNTWFRRETTLDDRPGWWFSESTDKHRSYWADHNIPHILVIQDELRVRRHWVRLDRTTIESTGSGIKVFVPEDQVLDGGAAALWIELVAEARKLQSFEGARWRFNVTQIPETEWPRYALLASRIVAPHPNQGFSSDINWAEALALCIQADHHRWDAFAAERDNVPSAEEAASSADPGWRFAAAVYQWMNGSTDQLEAMELGEVTPELRVAIAICLSILLEDRFELSAASQLLESLQDDQPSVDQAWLAVQKGWLLYESGDFEQADEQIRRSVAMHGSFASGIVNSAIRSAGILALFNMAPLLSGDVAAAVQASDTTLSWWQTQQVENALNRYLRNAYSGWVDDGTVTFGQSDSTHNDLYSAELAARLLGNRRSSQYATYLRSIANLTSPRGPHAAPAIQLEALRRSGYKKEMAAALKRFRRDGPLAPLATFMTDARPSMSTTTSIHADLEALEVAGSYLSSAIAGEWVAYLLDALDDPSTFMRRFRMEFNPQNDVLDALAGLTVHFTPDTEEHILGFALALPSDSDQLLVRALARVLTSLTEERLQVFADRLAARGVEHSAESWLGRLLVDLASPFAQEARAEVSRRMISGTLGAIPDGFRIDQMTLEEAIAVRDRCGSELETFSGQLNGIGIGGLDPYRTLAMIAMFGPDSTRASSWDVLIAGLSAEDVIHERKTQSIEYLVSASASIPLEWKEPLLTIASMLLTAPTRFSGFSFSGMGDVGPACRRLLVVLAAEDEHWAQSISHLLTGSSEDRSLAVKTLSERPGHELILLALSKDSDALVARAALRGLARRATEESSVAQFANEVLIEATRGRGEQAALSIGGGVISATSRCAESALLIGVLRGHESANIRRLAAELD